MKTTFYKLISHTLIAASLCIVILLSEVVNAESTVPINPNKIAQMTNKLAKKLLLSENQAAAVRQILKEYFQDYSAAAGNVSKQRAARQNATSKILAILDRKQKMKFDIIVNDWWAMSGT